MKRKMVPKSLTVIATSKLSNNYLRIRFSGEDLARMPEDCTGDYIKLIFSQNGSAEIGELGEGQRPIMRTYTIRHFDPMNQTLDVDFVLHDSEQSSGVASKWAANAQVGDTIKIGGPGHSDTVPFDLSHYVMFADMTSLPALSATVAQLSAKPSGDIYIQVSDNTDRQALEGEIDAPKGMQLHWLVASPHQPALRSAVDSISLPHNQAGVWCACEFSQMRAIRRHISDHFELERSHCYFSSYWKDGVTEDGHKVLKKEDAEAFSQKD
ncbi:siderophore-interacting protein [Vibrio agarivorans]|uniref:siderophore-interacting protein n=1 Tax=Vibrio agarivorans TaxID=153622 RepID=UPI002230D414|nr:siderophore-interacting protein [Vibrio agarivorans]MDN3663438.1 siderophore-interacting protein [Vibrio agarivorans]